MAGARQHRAEPGATTRPTKGGAVRIRIALSTAVAVIVVPSILFTLFSITPAAAAKRHEAGTRHRTVRVDAKVTPYSKAQKAAAAKQAAAAQKAAAAQQAAKLVTYSNA